MFTSGCSPVDVHQWMFTSEQLVGAADEGNQGRHWQWLASALVCPRSIHGACASVCWLVRIF
jgi:hypothetical protein